jgi:dihydrofolate reductase
MPGWDLRESPEPEETPPVMASLIYSAITSLDGYIADEEGNFDWAAPDEEVFAFVNDLEHPCGTALYGRRMYETLVGWETDEYLGDRQSVTMDFATIWRGADKVVFSRTLDTVMSARTRIERAFEADRIREMKASADRDLSIGGAELAAQAFQAGLVDECHLLLTPIIVGGGKRALPSKFLMRLALLDQRRFGNGVVHLHYRVRK